MKQETLPAALTDIKSLIEFQARQRGDQVFLIDPTSNKTITYSELLTAVRTTASAVNALGIKPGDSVAYALSNGLDCAVIVLGLLYGGFRATSVNLVAGANTIGYVLEHSQSRIVITQPEHGDLLDQALATKETAPETHYANQILTFRGGIKEAVEFANVLQCDDGLLMYTSGTTGQPKGVILSHSNLIAGGNNTATAHKLGLGDRAMCVLPLYHINGLCVTLMGPLGSGGSVVMPEKFSTSWGKPILTIGL